jgi:hypothetical protein
MGSLSLFPPQSEPAGWSVRTAWTRLVIRLVEHRELAQEPPGLEGGHGLFDQCADLRAGPVDGLLTDGKAVSSAAVGEADGADCALIALVRPAVDAGLGESVDDAVLACGPDVMDGPGRRW